MDHSPLGGLPPEVLEIVLLALPLKDALNVDILCRELEAVVKASPRLQHELFFKPQGKLLAQQWVDDDGAEVGRDFRLQYTTTAAKPASPPRANPSPPILVTSTDDPGPSPRWA
ncbi:hypothetical protein CLAFUW4_04149 [Fulvia fulva]|uniref:F-box domain-containing protein n=1 Tax=Passalora fulva TaxID=5499 RepID=A0A9Q8P7D7_PASFU|nr:uncharacterized protein CLAFUR5_04111 [Fulvia fulva]KAK4627126.1 hypothetical protein CLAFUR4_04135 [Fulvia fulva]UJO16035.1 hypothetical protein CLAFUR5_04111 [Fulvia fulva]WPV13456.1 hypothetical protein CLAFUW4_04149 [Fulvia fulva]WPV28889.1 hypothetical protein CLAFUW7_04138 [Fulvia fulva]